MRLFPRPKSRIRQGPSVFSFCQHQQLKQLNNRTTPQGHPAIEHQIFLRNFIVLLLIICFDTFQVYILNKAQIDPVMDKVKAQFDEISGKVFAMIPHQAKPAEKTE